MQPSNVKLVTGLVRATVLQNWWKTKRLKYLCHRRGDSRSLLIRLEGSMVRHLSNALPPVPPPFSPVCPPQTTCACGCFLFFSCFLLVVAHYVVYHGSCCKYFHITVTVIIEGDLRSNGEYDDMVWTVTETNSLSECAHTTPREGTCPRLRREIKCESRRRN